MHNDSKFVGREFEPNSASLSLSLLTNAKEPPVLSRLALMLCFFLLQKTQIYVVYFFITVPKHVYVVGVGVVVVKSVGVHRHVCRRRQERKKTLFSKNILLIFPPPFFGHPIFSKNEIKMCNPTKQKGVVIVKQWLDQINLELRPERRCWRAPISNPVR